MEEQSPQVGAVILARLDSRRLPGKALAALGDRPLLEHIVLRCRKARCCSNRVILATTARSSDDPLAEAATRWDIPVWRGPLEDTATRALEAADSLKLNYFFRVNGDSPFVDPQLLDEAASHVKDGAVQLVTNLSPRSFPYGVAVELLQTETLRSAIPQMTMQEREHVTPWFYRSLNQIRFINLSHDGPDLSGVRLTIDTVEDFQEMLNLIRSAKVPFTDLRWQEAVALLHGSESRS